MHVANYPMHKHNQKDWILHFWQSKILSSKEKRQTEAIWNILHLNIIRFDLTFLKLLLRGGGQGFSPATVNVAASNFHRKIEEK